MLVIGSVCLGVGWSQNPLLSKALEVAAAVYLSERIEARVRASILVPQCGAYGWRGVAGIYLGGGCRVN